MNDIVNKEFLKQKYKYNLLGHNLDCEDATIVDKEDYVIVRGKVYKPLWVGGSDNLSDEKFLELLDVLCDLSYSNDINICCNKTIYDYLSKFDYDLSNTFTYVCYQCNELIAPKSVDGCMIKSTLDDKEFIAEHWQKNSQDFGYDTPYEVCLKMAQKWIDSNNFYLWKNENNDIVSFIGYDVVDNTAEISHAYTIPSERGKGYMPNLVYEITKLILSKGLIPVLNTDYNYLSSNNAYKKVGYNIDDYIFVIHFPLIKRLDDNKKI